MQSLKSLPHLFLVVCIALGLSGYIPFVAPATVARAADPPPPARTQEEIELRASLAALQAQTELDAASRAQALALHTDLAENRSPLPNLQSPTGPNAPSADLTVGSAPCTYATIAAAIAAANPGDRLLIEGGVTFNENVVITKNMTLEGGYNGCGSGSSDPTTVDGGGADSVVETSNSVVTLRNLRITEGNASFGGGVNVLGSSRVTLDSADVFGNQATYGGGVYISGSSALTLTNDSDIANNTAASNGGGARVWGRFAGYGNDSEIYDNSAPDGGGFSAQEGALYLNNVRVYRNQATGVEGKGGGIHVYDGGIVTLTNTAFVYFLNQAYDGAGIYADNATVYLQGVNTTIRDNIAANNGGGVYLANNSALYSTNAHIGQAGATLANEAVRGAGLYVVASMLNMVGGSIINNIASSQGAGIYATASVITLTNAQVGGTAANEVNQLSGGSGYGVGLYLSGTHASLVNTVVSSNTFPATSTTSYGGGLYARSGSVVTLNNSAVESHYAPGNGRGAGLYVSDSTVTLDHSRVLSNTAESAGGGVRLVNASTLNILNGSELRNNHAINNGGGIAAGGTPDVNISDSTLQANTAGADGGAIHLSGGALDFTGWWDVQSNHVVGNGGAIAIVGTGDASFSVTSGAQQTFASNHADGNGGALYVSNNSVVELYATSGYSLNLKTNYAGGNGGAIYGDSGATFTVMGRVAANANQANGGNGGAFYLDGGSVWFGAYYGDKPELLGNSAQNGGAIYAINGSNVECHGARFGASGYGNQASSGSGGAIYLSGGALLSDNCIFRYNQAPGDGGAIAAYVSTLTVRATYPPPMAAMQVTEVDHGLTPQAPVAAACNPLTEECGRFYGNIADSDADDDGNGGAIYTNNSAVNVGFTHMYNNRAHFGGAIYQYGSSAAAQVANTLVYSNTSNSGALHRNGGAFTVTHSTLANNIVGAGFAGIASVVSNTIAWGNTAGGFMITPVITSCNIDQSGKAGLALDPQFVAPGVGENYHLQNGSLAIDACASGLPIDLGNTPRPFGASYDMGAYEYYIIRIFLPLVLRNN